MLNAKASSRQHVDVYKLKSNVVRTTMRSSHASWFIGTLFEKEHFFHIRGNHSYENGYIWGYSHNEYGAYGGFGWIRVEDIDVVPHSAKTHLRESTIHQLHNPISLRKQHFWLKYARPPYPPSHSKEAKGKVHIKPGVHVQFYGNYKYAEGKIGGKQHPQKPILIHTDDVRFRYAVRTNPNLIVVDYYRHHFHNHPKPGKGDGIWGVILKTHDNFTYDNPK